MARLLAALVLFVCIGPAHAGTFTGWSTNGSAQLIDGDDTISLTEPVIFEAGSAWSPGQVSLANDFSVAFSFTLYGGSNGGADGITITFQNSAAGLTALGAGGGVIGYSDIDHSVAFVYDTFDNGLDTDRVPGPNTSVAYDGNLVNPWGGNTVGTAYALREKVIYAWIDYSAATQAFTSYISDTNAKPANADMSIDSSYIGSSSVYVGFTAGTGGATDNQEILSFSLTEVPEPGTCALLLPALGALGCAARRRRG